VNLKTKKHKEINMEDFKGLSDAQLNTLTAGAKFLFCPPGPSKAELKSKPKSKQAEK